MLNLQSKGGGSRLYEWNEAIQKMIYWIEEHLTENPTLAEMSSQIGYSPYYCSSQFHRVVGMTIKKYISGRRLTKAALEVRDSSDRILDIALRYGYSSQEAFTRAFVSSYGCTPAAYRKEPVPIPLSILQIVFLPEHYVGKGDTTMDTEILKQPNVRIEHIPAHKYVGIWDIAASGYGDFWSRHDCDSVCGLIDSMAHVSHPIVTCHMAGWFYENGKRGYFYGFGVSADYDGTIPEGFEVRGFPASDYMVFSHPPFHYLKDNGEVMNCVERFAWNYKPESHPLGYEWNEEVCQDYQRHNPGVLGYEILRPVKRK